MRPPSRTIFTTEEKERIIRRLLDLCPAGARRRRRPATLAAVTLRVSIEESRGPTIQAQPFGPLRRIGWAQAAAVADLGRPNWLEIEGVSGRKPLTLLQGNKA